MANVRHSVVSILENIRENPSNLIRTSQFAEELGVASGTLIRICRAVTGLTPSRFRSCARMEQAKCLLLHSDLPITDISFGVGYESLGTFIRTFTRLVGISPTHFRRLAHQLTIDDILSAAFSVHDSLGMVGHPGDKLVLGSLPYDVHWSTYVVAIGLFAEARPVGRPLSGCVLLGCGRFELIWPAENDEVYVLAFRIPLTADPEIMWIPSSFDILVASHVLREDQHVNNDTVMVDLFFRRANKTDPPIVAPIPILLGVSSSRKDS